MGLVPDTKPAKTAFFRSMIAPWTAAPPTAIGTTTGAVTALDALVTVAEEKLAAQTSAEAVYRAAVAAADDAVEAMGQAGADIIAAIRVKGRTDSAVWALSLIPAPATPTPIGPPGTPDAMKAKLMPDGSLELGWACANPTNSQGTIYHVYRKLDGESEMTFIGGCGGRKFIDATLPMGVSTVVYKVQAVRSTAIGAAAQFIVQFGTTSTGAVMTTVTAASPKLAA
jgi:hypothetical protein